MEYTINGDEISVESCIVQATVALDATGTMAQQSLNSERMLEVADAWVKLADFMNVVEQARNEGHKPDRKVSFGFSKEETVHNTDGDFERFEQLEIEEDDARDDCDED